jgi:hypothetical protein
MVRIPALFLLLVPLSCTASTTSTEASSNKAMDPQDFSQIRTLVETLRGKKFLRDVLVHEISNSELRALSDREIDRQFPGEKLGYYEELLAWLDMLPAGTSLKAAEADFLMNQVAGLYDSVTKEMRIPAFSSGITNAGRKASEKLKESFVEMDKLVLAHEFTHALEDQYWPIDDPKDDDLQASTDRGTAHSFLTEGLATRVMIEAVPANIERDAPGNYFFLWDLIHSGAGEFVLRHALQSVWKSDDALVSGVPDTLARTQAIPYSFGYSFCADILRKWGLDGLDYIYDHRPVSSEQIMHPRKSWEWRDFPVQITLPESFPGNWDRISLDSLGEAGLAILFGCQFTNLNRGLQIAHGWDGDQVAMFAGPGNHRLLLWASSWDLRSAAERFANAWVKERQLAHQAAVTRTNANTVEWKYSNGRVGAAFRDGRHVILMESDDPALVWRTAELASRVTFIEPTEDAARAAANNNLRRFNPVWSRQTDGDYNIARSLWGLISRHDRNNVGAADRFLLGLLAESCRTDSFKKWQVGGSLVVSHESEARRGYSQTTVLPWGLLASHSCAKLPYSPDRNMARMTFLWGIGAATAVNGAGVHSVRALPFGLLFSQSAGPGQCSFHILGTGFTRKTTESSSPISRYRFLGVPVGTSPARRDRRTSLSSSYSAKGCRQEKTAP